MPSKKQLTPLTKPRADGSVIAEFRGGPYNGMRGRAYPDNAADVRKRNHTPDWPNIVWPDGVYEPMEDNNHLYYNWRENG